MEKVFKIFHTISHVKYPIMIVALYYCYKPIIYGGDGFSDYNKGLILMGIAVSLDSLKDYNKLNKLDKLVYHNPRRAAIFFPLFGLFLMGIILVGVYHYFVLEQGPIKEMSMGLMIFAIGCLGMLRSAMQSTKDFMDEQKNS